MPESAEPDVTLNTLHRDLGDLKADVRDLKTDMGEVKADVREVKADVREVKADVREVKTDVRELKTLVAGALRGFAPDWPGEMLRLLRENNRLSEARFAQLDVTLREQALETNTVLRTFAAGQNELVGELRALIARVDALIRGRRDGRSG